MSVEVAGIEPASEGNQTEAPTRVGIRYSSPEATPKAVMRFKLSC